MFAESNLSVAIKIINILHNMYFTWFIRPNLTITFILDPGYLNFLSSTFFTEKDEKQTIITFIIHFFCAGRDSSNIMLRRE